MYKYYRSTAINNMQIPVTLSKASD